MTIKQMETNVVRTFGFGHEATRYFFEECERTHDMVILKIAYEFAMNWPLEEDEDW